VTRLATWMPFGQAVKEAGHFLHVTLTEATVRRQSEAAGAAYVTLPTRAVEQLEHEGSRPAAGVAKQFMSVDGVFVPVLGGEWAEVKTLAIGTVEAPRQVKGETVIHSGELSYFSRLTDATTFQRLALVETQRRGLDRAPAGVAVTDGSEWCQGFVDFHRPDAVRILDFPQAGEHVADIGQAAFADKPAHLKAWLTEQLHPLKHDGSVPVLAVAQQLAAEHPDHLELAQALAYLVKRQAQLEYPTFQAQGWPIGDGAIESANKLVVEARLKGSGMHWARNHVDPMLALRNIACNDRWDEAWPQITQELRRQSAQLRSQRSRKRRAQTLPTAATPPQPALKNTRLSNQTPAPPTTVPESPK
ncbi:MAG: ISKra4 family transposase, partial [Aggregatilineales bacterium]